MMRGLRCGACFAVALSAGLASACSPPPDPRPLLAPAPGSPFAVTGAPGSIALGDTDGDGRLDLVVASGRGINVLLGRGDGRFHATPGSPLQVPVPPTEMVLADLDGDGTPDLALASHDSYAVTLLHGDGKGGFAPAAGSPVVMRDGKRPHTHGLRAGDLDGDRHLDLVSVNSDDDDVSVAFGDGHGGFARAPFPFAVGASPYPGALADLDGDGRLDIIATSTSRRSPEGEAATSALTVLLGDGRGSFRSTRVPLRTVTPGFVVAADVNGDRKPDLLTSHLERSELTVLLGDGKGAFAEAGDSPYDLGLPAWHIAAADVNGDRRVDVVAAAGSGVRVMLGDGKGGFAAAAGSPFAAGKGAWQLAVGDVNGDGKPDVATSNLESDSVTILLGR